MDEIRTQESLPTMADCLSLVNTCCQMLHASIAFQASAQERQSTLCENMVSQLNTIIELCDKRTERIESAALSLSKACETNNTVIKLQSKTYTQSIEQHIKDKDQLMHSHQLLLKEFEAQRRDLQHVRDKMFDLCQQFAIRPTTNISNSK